MLLFAFEIVFIAPDLHYRYSRDQIHHILVWSDGNDSLQSAIQHWYVIMEDIDKHTQKEIDSTEAIITKYSQYVWEK